MTRAAYPFWLTIQDTSPPHRPLRLGFTTEDQRDNILLGVLTGPAFHDFMPGGTSIAVYTGPDGECCALGADGDHIIGCRSRGRRVAVAQLACFAARHPYRTPDDTRCAVCNIDLLPVKL